MKKVLILCVLMALGFVAATGTLAYFTDTVEANQNVIEAGNVDVTQHEYERVREADGTYAAEPVLAEFASKPMYPAMDPAEGDAVTGEGSQWKEYTILGSAVKMPDETYMGLVDKIVTVTNEGSLAAYVRTYVAIPTQTFGSGAETVSIPWLKLLCNEEGWTWGGCIAARQTIVIDDVSGEYDIYMLTYDAPLLPGAQTTPGLLGLYMCGNVDVDETGYYVTDGNGSRHTIGMANEVKVLVATTATQGNQDIMGTDASAALDMVFKPAEGADAYHPWQK